MLFLKILEKKLKFLNYKCDRQIVRFLNGVIVLLIATYFEGQYYQTNCTQFIRNFGFHISEIFHIMLL